MVLMSRGRRQPVRSRIDLTIPDWFDLYCASTAVASEKCGTSYVPIFSNAVMGRPGSAFARRACARAEPPAIEEAVASGMTPARDAERASVASKRIIWETCARGENRSAIAVVVNRPPAAVMRRPRPTNPHVRVPFGAEGHAASPAPRSWAAASRRCGRRIAPAILCSRAPGRA